MNQSFVEQVNTPGALPPEELERTQHLYENILLQTDGARIAGRAARTYAEALLAVADQRGEADAVSEQFDSLFRDVFPAAPQLEAFLDAPVAGKVRKDEMIDKVFSGQASPLFVDFLKLLNQKHRLGQLRLIAVAYRALREQKANRVRVLVETAAPLAADQQDKLRATLSAALNKTPVLVVREKPDLIGGMVVHVGDRVIDTSVRSRLQTLRTQLTNRGR